MARHNLPAHLPSLIGRDEMLSEVADRVLKEGLLTLAGTGGSGKTRLAISVAASVLDDFPDGVWLAELAPLADPELVPSLVATSVGVREQTGRPIRDTLIDELRSRSLLLVLDNCEHLVDVCATLAADLLRSCPGLRILATSREPLRIASERVVLVPPLAAPNAGQEATIEELSTNPAVRLFMERAQAVQPALSLTPETRRAIAGICARLEGLPLALELAAARTRVLPPEQIMARLDDAFRLLVGGSRAAAARHQTLKATLDWSFQLLDRNAQQGFESLAVFAGGFDLEAAEAMWSSGRGGDFDPLEMLTGLVDRSLVVAQPRDGSMRYRLLEPVRQYAEQRLTERGAWEASRTRHARYFQELAAKAEHGLQGAAQELWVARLELEHDNLRAVLRRCLDAGEGETTLRISSALLHFWRHRGYRNEGRRWLEEALAAGGAVAPAIQANAVQTAAQMAYAVGDYQGARTHLETAVRLFKQLDNRAGLGTALPFYGRLLARTAQTPAEYEHGKATLWDAIRINREIGDHWWAGMSMLLLGNSTWEHIELEEATVVLEEAEALLRQNGEGHLHGHVILQLGGVTRDQGDLDRAQQLIEQSLVRSRAIQCLDGTAEALYFLAGLTRQREDATLAAKHAVECLLLKHRLGNTAEMLACVELLGGLECDQRHPERAVRLFAAASKLREGIGLPRPPTLRLGFERDVAGARAALSAPAFNRAWAAGESLNVDQLVEYARQTNPVSPATLPDLLSQREREVVALIVRGLTNRQIAEELIISERTADGHVTHILAKLGVATRAQAAVWAVEHKFAGFRG
jgi:predicted ATPase/DNA-binding CsgD family transcriptional regulator